MNKKEVAVVRNMFGRNLMRIAVVAVLILGASAVYKYTIVNGISVYNNNFSEYELGTARGNGTGDKLEAAYRARDWAGVLNAFSAGTVKDNRAYFLAGMAELELKKYPEAIQHFETVLTNNSSSGNYFRPESEYYLALAYLANNQNAKGIELIKKIRSDIYHPYYPLASKIATTDLKIVELKK